MSTTEPEDVWSVDVWFSTTFPVNPLGDDWRRVLVAAPDAVEAELLATQVVSRRGTPVRSLVVDWPAES